MTVRVVPEGLAAACAGVEALTARLAAAHAGETKVADDEKRTAPAQRHQALPQRETEARDDGPDDHRRDRQVAGKPDAEEVAGVAAPLSFGNGSKTSLQRAIAATQRAATLVYCVYVAAEREEREEGRSGGQRQGGGYPGGGYPGGGGPFPGGGYPGGGGQRRGVAVLVELSKAPRR